MLIGQIAFEYMHMLTMIMVYVLCIATIISGAVASAKAKNVSYFFLSILFCVFVLVLGFVSNPDNYEPLLRHLRDMGVVTKL